MTSHPDPSVLSAMLRDREREADATSEEVARLRAEVAGLTAERDWLLNRYVDATNCEAESLRIAACAMREGLAECKRLRSDQLWAVADAARDVAALCHAEHPALEHLRVTLARLDGGP